MADRVWSSRHTGLRYDVIRQYDRSHLAIVVTGVLAAGALVVAARRLRGLRVERMLRQIVALVLGILAIAYLAYTLRADRLVLDETLPFHLSDWLRLITPLALGTGNEFAVTLSFFWGLLLNPMALLTPDAAWVVDRRVQEVGYWLFHWAASIIPLILTFGLGYRVTWRGYRFVLPVTAGWMAVAGMANRVTGGNYGFLARKPRGRSIIDIFGRWPWYIIVEVVLVTVAWAGMAWASERSSRGGWPAPRGLIRRV